MKKILVFLFIIFSNTFVFSGIDIYIQAVKTGKRINIGISKFVGKDLNSIKISSEVQQVVRDDIMFTRLFNVVEPGWQYLPNKIVSEKWQRYGIDVVVCGEVKYENNVYILVGKMYDVLTTEKIYEKEFRGSDLRYLAHLFSDHIVCAFTGEYGIATTRIVFVNDMTGYKEIYIVDYDGYNLKQLTNDRSINIYPRVSPDGQKIVYTTYKDRNPDLYIMDINGRNKSPISMFQGLNVTANWSPDGENLVVTLTKAKHSPNMYILNLKTKDFKRITYGDTIDIAGYFSPNGREIVFISNRIGVPQIYISSVDGSSIRRLPTERYSASPVWSPKGDRIVFSMQGSNGLFDIYLYDIAKNEYYRLTQDSGSNENPYFSPDGRFIVFSSNRSGRWELYTMFLDGSNQRRIADIKGNSFYPCWTPRRL